MNSKENRAILEMLLCATLWSIAGILFKLIPWNGFAVAGMRSLVAGITIYVSMRLMGFGYVLNRRTLAAGFFSSCTYLCFTVANKLTTSANAIVLQFTSPIFIIIYSVIFFGVKPKKRDLIVVLATLAGISLFFFDQLKPGYLLGNFVAIAAGMFMAGMYVAVGEIKEEERFSGILNGQILTFLAVSARPVLCALCEGQQILPAALLLSARRDRAAFESRLGLPLQRGAARYLRPPGRGGGHRLHHDLERHRPGTGNNMKTR